MLHAASTDYQNTFPDNTGHIFIIHPTDTMTSEQLTIVKDQPPQMKTKKPIKKSAPKKVARKTPGCTTVKNPPLTKRQLQKELNAVRKVNEQLKRDNMTVLAQNSDWSQKYNNVNKLYADEAKKCEVLLSDLKFFKNRISDDRRVIEAYKETAVEFASSYTQQMNEATKLDHENRKLTVAIDVLMNLKSAESVMGTECQRQIDPEFEVENVFNRKYKKHKKPDFADGGPITNRTNEERSAFGLTAKDSIQLAADAMKKLHDFLGGDKTK